MADISLTEKSWFWPGILMLLVLVALGGCGRRDTADIPSVNINLTVIPDSPQAGPATIILTLTETPGQPITGATVELEGNMNHAGMTPVFAQATEMSPGRYEGALEFTMGGDWVIIVRVTLSDNRKLERQLELKGVQAP